MDCTTFRKSLDDDALLSVEAAEHALTCAACSSRLDQEPSNGLAIDVKVAHFTASEAASLRAVKRLIRKDRGLIGSLRALPTWWRVTLALAALALGMLLELRGQPPSELALHGATFTLAAAGLFWPLSRFLPSYSRGAAAITAVVLPFLFAFWTHQTHAPYQLEKRALPCLLFGMLLSAPFFAVLCALDRRAALGIERSLLAGASAGVAGNALLHLHCASTSLEHLLASHALLGVSACGLAGLIMMLRSRSLARGH